MNDLLELPNLLLLAVAVLIFLRLRSVLGRRTGNERARPVDPDIMRKPTSARSRDNVIPLPRQDVRSGPSDTPSSNVEQRLAGVSTDSKARQQLQAIATLDSTFDTGSFVKGACSAYEIILAAYAKGDRETLRNLLSREVYDSFSAVIAEREGRGETTEFSFVGITSSELVDAHLVDRIAHVTVKFVSELVTAVRNRGGEVVEGDVKSVRQVTDYWTFMRDISLSNPNWRLVATDAP